MNVEYPSENDCSRLLTAAARARLQLQHMAESPLQSAIIESFFPEVMEHTQIKRVVASGYIDYYRIFVDRPVFSDPPQRAKSHERSGPLPGVRPDSLRRYARCPTVWWVIPAGQYCAGMRETNTPCAAANRGRAGASASSGGGENHRSCPRAGRHPDCYSAADIHYVRCGSPRARPPRPHPQRVGRQKAG